MAEQRTNIRLKQEIYDAAKEAANSDGISLAEWLRRAVEARLGMATGAEPDGSNSWRQMAEEMATQTREKDSQISKLQSMIESLQEDATQKNALHLNLQNQLERQQFMLESTQTKLERQREPWYKRVFTRNPTPTSAEE